MKIRKRINPKLGIAGILMTMCESRTKLCKILTEEVAENFQEQIRVFDTKIPNTVKVGESIYYILPVVQYSSEASAGVAYRKFAKELISYEGERLDDMVESIKEHGILNPVIVWQDGDGYEMLAGHNRQMAGKLAGLTEIPAIVKTNLTEEEAYVYVIETNVIQRGYAILVCEEFRCPYHKKITDGVK